MNKIKQIFLKNSAIYSLALLAVGLFNLQTAVAVPIDITFRAQQLGAFSNQNYVINYSVYKITLTDPLDFVLTLDSDDPNAGGTLRYSYNGNAEIRYYAGSRPVLATTKATISGVYDNIHYKTATGVDPNSDVNLSTFLANFGTTDGGTHNVLIDNTGNLLAQAYLGIGKNTHEISLMGKGTSPGACTFCFSSAAGGAQFTGWYVGSSPTLGNLSGDIHLRLLGGFNFGEPPPPPGEVPEPMTLGLLLPSLVGLALRKKI